MEDLSGMLLPVTRLRDYSFNAHRHPKNIIFSIYLMNGLLATSFREATMRSALDRNVI